MANRYNTQLLGKNLKRLIKEHGYTQEEFARDIVLVHPTTLRKWIQYGIERIDRILFIANFFNVSVEELFT